MEGRRSGYMEGGQVSKSVLVDVGTQDQRVVSLCGEERGGGGVVREKVGRCVSEINERD